MHCLANKMEKLNQISSKSLLKYASKFKRKVKRPQLEVFSNELSWVSSKTFTIIRSNPSTRQFHDLDQLYRSILQCRIETLVLSHKNLEIVYIQQMTSTLKNPLDAIVASFAKELIVQFNGFSERCRNHAIQQADDPDFMRTMANQGNTINKAPVQERKEVMDESQAPKPAIKRGPYEDTPLKRPRNAYNLFVASQSVKIKEQNPHMRAPDIVRIAAERYNSMTPEQKRPYVQKFEEAKRLYEEQQMDFSRSGSIAGNTMRRGRGRGGRSNYSLN